MTTAPSKHVITVPLKHVITVPSKHGETAQSKHAEVDTDMVQISATIPLELKEKMEAEKAKSGETTAELIIRVLKSL